MQQAGYHHANALAQKISHDIKYQLHERDTQMLAMLQAIPSLQSSSGSDDTQEDEHLEQLPPVQHAANISSTNYRMQIEMLRLLKELSADIRATRDSTKRDRNGQVNQRVAQKTPNDGGKLHANISKYCWMHGACQHSSNTCRNKARGHQDHATFQDKKGGSLACCE